MSKKKTEYNRNHYAARKYFKNIGYKLDGMVLHHKDVNLKKTDPKRYNQWNPEDLVVMSVAEHRKLHMKLENPKGKAKTRTHKRHISEGMRNYLDNNKNARIHVHRDAVAEVDMYFDSCAQAALWIGCTKQLVSQAARGTTPNRKAKGFNVEYVTEG